MLDDSTSAMEKKMNLRLAAKSKNVIYHNVTQQKNVSEIFCRRHLKHFIGSLGSTEWNLGYVRNYAVLISTLLDSKYTIFSDDDIVVRDRSLFPEMFALLKDHEFVGTRTVGMPDDSIIGHVQRALHVSHNVDFISSGFLAFRTNAVSQYFLNCYNEDLIWLSLHALHAQITRNGAVYQIPYDEFQGAVSKAVWQEYGELIAEGVRLACLSSNPNGTLTDQGFWRTIIEQRSVDLERLEQLSRVSRHGIGLEITRVLLKYIKDISPITLANTWVTYQERLGRWMGILREARRFKIELDQLR
jgi:hypothetical protein